jgi:hypothetical protein
VKLVAELLLALGGGLGVDGLLVCLLGELSVLDAVEVVVGKFRAECREDGFESPSAVLAF